jgi:hydrogenase maturation protease
MENKKKILILGIGNLLFRDEGIGIHVVRRLQGMSLPPDVEVMDGATSGFDLVYVIENRGKVVVLNAMQGGGPPGTVYRFTDKEMEEKRKGYPGTLYENEFIDYLKTARFLGTVPDEVVFLGIEPEDMGEKDLKGEIILSPTLEKKVPEIIEMVMKEIEI